MDEQEIVNSLGRVLDDIFKSTIKELESITLSTVRLRNSIDAQIEILKNEQKRIEDVLNA
jgi:hypothetical protein